MLVWRAQFGSDRARSKSDFLGQTLGGWYTMEMPFCTRRNIDESSQGSKEGTTEYRDEHRRGSRPERNNKAGKDTQHISSGTKRT